MQQMADRISEKIHTLSTEQLAEVERFVESLQVWQNDREIARMMKLASEPALQSVWSNPEDDVYDDL